MKLSRPKSILWFERFYFLSFGFELLDEYVNWQARVADIDLGESIYMLLWLVIIAITLIIWYFIAIKAKSWARWAQIILAGLGVITLLAEIGTAIIPAFEDAGLLNVVWENMEWPETLTVLYLAFVVFNIVATYFLFRKDAIKWVEEKQVSIDTVFD